MNTSPKPRICHHCKRQYTPKRKDQIYCNQLCNWKAWDKRHPRISKNSSNHAL